MLDEACFCFENFGDIMETMTFRELSDKLVALYGQGKFEDALYLTEQNQEVFPDQRARTTFWRMCLLSLTGRSEAVVSVFQQGLDSGLWWAAELFVDPDLNAVRELPDFQRLVAISQEKCEKAQGQIQRDQAILLPDAPATGPYPLLIALHGHNGSKDTHLEYWESARQRGWLVLSVQSTQATFPGAYHWNDPEQGLADLLFYFEQVSEKYPIDLQRIIMAGFSQGSGMTMWTVLSSKIPARGFIGIASWWPDPKALAPQSEEAKRVRGYFITGEKDHTLETARQIQKVLRENNIQFVEEVHPDLGHEFPSDFESSFQTAIKFIME
jgi:predicted esterase